MVHKTGSNHFLRPEKTVREIGETDRKIGAGLF
jgi:hypothetical protein